MTGAAHGRRASRRPRGRLLWRAAAAVVLAGGVAGGGWWALHTAAFRVTTVVVTPGHHTSASAILLAAAITGQPAMVDLDAGAISRRVEDLPWVATATVDERWPHTVAISITERHPVAVAVTNVHGHGEEVDASGRVLGPAIGHTHLPRLVVDAVPKRAGSHLDRADLVGFSVLETLPRAFAGQVRGVAVHDGRVSLLFPGPVTFLLGDTSSLRAKYVAVATMIERAQFSAGDSVDVTVPDAVVVTHAS